MKPGLTIRKMQAIGVLVVLISQMQWTSSAGIMNSSRRQNRITQTDAYNLYLAYHEGNGGWARGTYNSKGWLMDVARNVQNTANVYQNQYQGCERELGRNWFMRLFF